MVHSNHRLFYRPTMTKNKTLREIVDLPDVGITMPDGCRLSARIWLPADADTSPVPAIVEHLPYRKRDGTVQRDEITHPYLSARGYACIRVDMRGNGESQGLMLDEYTEQELQDACHVIQWAGQQPWCTGKVGMMGISWGGFNSLQVAALQPAGLKAIITVCSTVDRFADDIHYKGGCLLTENIGWAANMLSYSSRPPDPLLLKKDWRTMWLQRLDNMPFLASTWLRHQHRNDYWKHGSVCEDYSSIKTAVLSIGGWHDGYRNTISHLVENISAPVKGIVGPWIHKYPHYAAPAPAIGFLQESLRWWDRWLKDSATDVEYDPAYRVWLMDSIMPHRWLPERPGKWIGESSWPSPNVVAQEWHISTVTETTDKQNISQAQLQHEAGVCDLTVSTPQQCGAGSGEYFPFTFGPELPDDQTDDDLLSVVADSKLTDSVTDIVGAPTLEVSIASSAQTGLIAVRLLDLRPDGTSALITYGVLNLQHRFSFEKPTPLTPNKHETATVVLDQIAYRLPAGHRLRVALSNTYWPLVWPSPEITTLHVQSAKLYLPVRGFNDEDSVRFPPAEKSREWQAQELRAPTAARRVFKDDTTGEYITRIENDFGEYLDLSHGLLSGSLVTENWRINADDPLSAGGEIHWMQSGGRDEWHWKTDVNMTVSCDSEFFYITARLDATENGQAIFSRDFSDKIKREFV